MSKEVQYSQFEGTDDEIKFITSDSAKSPGSKSRRRTWIWIHRIMTLVSFIMAIAAVVFCLLVWNRESNMASNIPTHMSGQQSLTELDQIKNNQILMKEILTNKSEELVKVQDENKKAGMLTKQQTSLLQQHSTTLKQQNSLLQIQNHTIQKQLESMQQQNQSLMQQRDAIQTQTETLKQQNDKLAKLEEENNKLQRVTEQQSQLLEQQQTTLAEIKDERTAILREMEQKLGKHNETLDNFIYQQNNRTVTSIMQLQKMIGNLQNRSTSLVREVDTMKEQLEKYNNTLGTGEVASTRPAFTAHKSRGFSYYSDGDKITLTTTQINIGNHYNTTTSVFTCPVNGLYLFMYSLYSASLQSGKRCSGTLMVEGSGWVEVYSRNHDPDHAMFTQSSQTLVVKCPVGGKVYLVSDYDNVQIYGNYPSDQRTIFSGILLQELA